MNKELIKKLEKELEELDEKIAKISKFISTCNVDKVGRKHWQLLCVQYSAMRTYYDVLSARIELLESESKEEDDSMKLTITIPKEFVDHYNRDKFEDSFNRIIMDIQHSILSHDTGLAGNYEIELISMLIEAFKNSKESES